MGKMSPSLRHFHSTTPIIETCLRDTYSKSNIREMCHWKENGLIPTKPADGGDGTRRAVGCGSGPILQAAPPWHAQEPEASPSPACQTQVQKTGGAGSWKKSEPVKTSPAVFINAGSPSIEYNSTSATILGGNEEETTHHILPSLWVCAV